MVARAKYRVLNECGQAAIEMGLTLPLLIWLLYYTLNAFHTIHTGHVGQKYAAMNLYQRLDNQAKFSIDNYENQGRGLQHRRDYMAVQYTEPDGRLPRRKIALDRSQPALINSIMGICKEPGCD